MTILQTLITKRGPLAKDEEKPSIVVSSEDDEEEEPVRNELSDEERKYRNLLGLRAKGPVDGKLLEKNYLMKKITFYWPNFRWKFLGVFGIHRLTTIIILFTNFMKPYNSEPKLRCRRFGTF